jgi:hypothetical protein
MPEESRRQLQRDGRWAKEIAQKNKDWHQSSSQCFSLSGPVPGCSPWSG